MIDAASLPRTAMVDTGVFLRFLGARPGDPDAPVCRAFCEAMLERGHVLYVAAPTLCPSLMPLPSTPGVPSGMPAKYLGA